MPVKGKSFLKIASHDQRSLRGRGNSILVENLHIQIVAINRNIDRECHLQEKLRYEIPFKEL